MRIAFLVVKNIARGGGIEKYTLELGSRLVKRGHEVTVYSMRHYGEVPDSYLGMRIISVPSLTLPCMQKLSCSAIAAIKSSLGKAFDIMHFHSIAAGSFAWISRLRGQRCVLQMHGIEWQRSRWGTFGSWTLKFLERLSLLQADLCTAVSKTQCDYYANHLGINTHYVPPGASVKPKTKVNEILELGLQHNRYIFFASRLVRDKGAHYLIGAFKRLKTDMKLVIAGDVQGGAGYKSELMDLAGEDPRILFPGFVGGRLLEELFSNAYLYVQPSEIEGLAIALLEAMSYGNCCLVSDIPENLEAIADTGFHFTNKNVDSLAERLNWLLEHRQEVASAGISAKEHVKQHYSWELVTDQIEKLYLSALHNQ